MHAQSIQFDQCPGRLYVGYMDGRQTTPNALAAAIDKFVHDYQIQQICPLLTEDELNLTCGLNLKNYYRSFDYECTFFPMDRSAQIQPGKVYQLATDLLFQLNMGRNVLVHGKDSYFDRAPIVAACIARVQFYMKSSMEVVSAISSMIPKWAPPPNGWGLINHMAPIEIKFKMNQKEHTVLRHINLGGFSSHIYKNMKVSHILLMGENPSLQRIYQKSGIAAECFPFSRGGALAPSALKELLKRIKELISKNQIPLLLDVNNQCRSMYVLCCLSRSMLQRSTEQTIDEFCRQFPGTEFTSVQERSIRAPKKEPEPHTPFIETLKEVNSFSLDPGKGVVYQAELPYELGTDSKTVIKILNEKKITHLFVIASKCELAEVDAYQGKLEETLRISRITFTHIDPTDAASFKQASTQLITNSMIKTHSVVCCSHGSHHASILITAAIAQSERISVNEALAKLGYEPALSESQYQLLEGLQSG